MASDTVTYVDTGPHRVSRRIVVDAPAADVFALIVNPHRHPELDGSGTVRDTAVKGPEMLTPGARFSVGMKQFGVPYTITSTATEVDTDRVVEWKHPMGHRWRWDLVATSPTTTQVTETFDYSTLKFPKIMELIGYDKKNGQGIEGTLRALANRFG
ncbi:SRPBCC family protein [Gordonia rubripertincta]|uniref:SRPBCC family protein n=1 Tax=Gordonia rubripertincta TaxID=36822 RepID=A0AAW4G0C5_GORRU|nr:SRPBCC family protein [Gordonia rubripertincta]MBM7276600.1 SRPBCC family protein [Gordonia rubripertincta]QMU21350.1 SRPBCC family protein [Gordonia rubripertincta]